MEKVIWVRSNAKMLGAKEDDGLSTVMESVEDPSDKTKRAKMLPFSFCIKA